MFIRKFGRHVILHSEQRRKVLINIPKKIESNSLKKSVPTPFFHEWVGERGGGIATTKSGCFNSMLNISLSRKDTA